MRLAGVVQGDVLFRNEARADAHAQVLVEEARDVWGGDVAPALEEAAGQDGNGVGVGGDELGEGGGEGDLVREGRDGRLMRRVVPRQEGGEGVDVVVVDAVDVGVRDDDVREVAEGLDAVGEADGDEGEGEVG